MSKPLVYSAKPRSLTFSALSPEVPTTVISAVPNYCAVATSEILPLVFDFANLLLPVGATGTEVLTAVSSTLTDITTTATPVTLTDNPTLNSPATSITQIIRGSTEMTAAHQFRLVVTGTVSATKLWSISLDITCPF